MQKELIVYRFPIIVPPHQVSLMDSGARMWKMYKPNDSSDILLGTRDAVDEKKRVMDW